MLGPLQQIRKIRNNLERFSFCNVESIDFYLWIVRCSCEEAGQLGVALAGVQQSLHEPATNKTRAT
jgi:hypothetical protein